MNTKSTKTPKAAASQSGLCQLAKKSTATKNFYRRCQLLSVEINKLTD